MIRTPLSIIFVTVVLDRFRIAFGLFFFSIFIFIQITENLFYRFTFTPRTRVAIFKSYFVSLYITYGHLDI